MNKKPRMELLGHDGNIFAIMGRASALLREAGQGEQAKEMIGRVTSSHSYDDALRIISEFVETELSVPQRQMPPVDARHANKHKEKKKHHER